MHSTGSCFASSTHTTTKSTDERLDLCLLEARSGGLLQGRRSLRVVGGGSKRGEKQMFAAGFVTTPLWFYGDKYRLNLFENSGIFELQHPAAVDFVILVEDSHAERVLFVCFSQAPRLEGTCGLHSALLVQIECVENEGFLLGVKHSPERFLCFSTVVDIEDI